MKYLNLYKYSTDSAPDSLRWPIRLCKIALVCSILSVAFFLVLSCFVCLNILPDKYVIPLIIFFTSLLIISLISSMIAYQKFNEYKLEREVSTAVVNRHFDKLDIQRWSKTYIKDPIVSQQRTGGPTVLVPRDSVRRGPAWLLDEVPKQSRFTVWSKWMRSSRRFQQDVNNNSAHKRGDMTL